MERELEQLRAQAFADLVAATSEAELTKFETAYFGRQGSLTRWLKKLPGLPLPERKQAGAASQKLRRELVEAIAAKRSSIPSGTSVDPTLPGTPVERGHLHPLTLFTRRMLEAWRALGYDLHEGPELERDWYNFEGLNIPPEHPSRDIQDTFFIQHHPELVLRTHSSTVQLRALHHRSPPLKMVEIGRVYRHEATDASHESMFTQCDGVAIGPGLTMANLVTSLKQFFKLLYGRDVTIRVRPSYFPFVEPGIEIDMQWQFGGQKRWLEILGAGMIHPNVLKAMKLDPKRWSGFAFGMGVDRLMMLDYGVDDVRLSYSGNLSFIQQF